MTEILKVDLNSKDIKSENINRLKELFPEIVTEGKIDFDKLKLTLGEEIDLEKEKYGMMWAGKARCFQIIQDRTTGTLKPVREESVDFDTTKNLFIEGDNLEVLKILQKSYFEKIKMIYIDPPYNTGKDFVYKDKFGQQLEEYLKLTNQVDSEGKKLSTNTDSDGRYHSNWMNMMYPRLYLARNLLKEDGVIFISIDDNEVDNLKKICNEIFGEENFVNTIIWQRASGGGNAKGIVTGHDFVLVYQKNIVKLIDYKGDEIAENRFSKDKIVKKGEQTFYINDDVIRKKFGKYDEGIERRCYYEELSEYKNATQIDEIEAKLKSGEYFLLKQNNNKHFIATLIEKGTRRKLYSIIQGVLNNQGFGDFKRINFNPLFFDYPKPVNFMKKLISAMPEKKGIILDFFAGSATTAHAVLDLNKEDKGNRKFICVQLPEATKEDSEAFKAGHKNICEIGKERIRRVITKIKEEQKQQKLSEDNKLDLGFKVFKLDRSNFKTWNGFTKDIQTTLTDNIEQIKQSTDKEAILYELLLKEGFSLTEDITKLQVSDKQVYSINIDESKLLICLEDKLTLDLFKELKKLNPTTVIVLDKGFNENDQLKTNAVELLTKVDNDTNKKEYLLKAI
jgi:adenine-specific DNA-methyltransferase